MQTQMLSPQEALCGLSRYLPELLGRQDMCVIVAEGETYRLIDFFGKFNIPVKTGDKMLPESTPALAIRRQETIVRHVPPEVYGVPVKSVCVPVPDGVIGLSYTVEAEHDVQEATAEFSAAMAEISASSDVIASDSGAVSTAMGQLVNGMDLTDRKITAVGKAGALIKGVARRSHFLAINARIEAARSGVHGRGFAVVAEEMQKLADESDRAIREVDASLAEIREAWGQMRGLIEAGIQHLQEQSTHTVAISERLKAMTTALSRLETLSQAL